MSVNVSVTNIRDQKVLSQLTLNAEIFDQTFNPSLVHQVVVAYRNAARQGTKAQKSRGMVTGSTAKPWRQKGTGRARAGSVKSPIWVGGGKTFAAVPRDYSQKVNRKMYRGAMVSLLSELIRREQCVVVEGFEFEAPKTKEAIAMLSPWLGRGALLLVSDNISESFYLSIRNLPNVYLSDALSLDPLSLVMAEKVIITARSMEQLQERFS